jgi:Bacteriophage Sf6, terminase small subunit-like
MAETQREAGRPTKRTPEAEATIRKALGMGHDWKTASALAGVSDRTVRSWRDQDPEFSAALDQARHTADDDAVVELWKVIRKEELDSAKLAAIKLYLTSRTEAFREKKEIDLTVDDKRSVLVVPQRATSADEWLKTDERLN